MVGKKKRTKKAKLLIGKVSDYIKVPRDAVDDFLDQVKMLNKFDADNAEFDNLSMVKGIQIF